MPRGAPPTAPLPAVGDVVAASHLTGDGKYTDKLQFMFENADGGDDCEDDSGWEKHPAKKGKTLDCDWVARSPKKRCKKKNKGGTKAAKACACACA